QAEARSRWFLGFRERQTLHLQWIRGTPVEVPQPRMVSFMLTGFLRTGARFQPPRADGTLGRMRISTSLIGFLAGSALLMGSCKSSDDLLGVELDFDVRTLSNGLAVVMAEDHTAPVISYQ